MTDTARRRIHEDFLFHTGRRGRRWKMRVARRRGEGEASPWRVTEREECGIPAWCRLLIVTGRRSGSWRTYHGALAKEFTQSRETDDASFPTTEERGLLLQQLGVDISSEAYSRNLERLMELLFSLRFALQRSSLESASTQLTTVHSLIAVQTFLWTKCTRGAFANGDTTVMDLYESFYRKLVLRDRSLPRPWVFTTNYDLFNETAMDRLGLPYANGFSACHRKTVQSSDFSLRSCRTTCI